MLNYNDIKREVKKVVGYSGGVAAFSLGFNKDLLSLEWVDDYIKDKKIQDKIDHLDKTIKEIRIEKISKNELRTWLDGAMDRYRQFQLDQLKIIMKQLQNRELPFFSFSDKIGLYKINGGDIHPYIFNLTDDEKDALFADLEKGMTTDEIDRTIKEKQANIEQLEAVREEKYSPKSRWVYKDTGERLPYPNGCRWTIYVKLWELVAPQFDGIVDNLGYKAKSGKMVAAYAKLGLDKQRTRVNPMAPFGGVVD